MGLVLDSFIRQEETTLRLIKPAAAIPWQGAVLIDYDNVLVDTAGDTLVWLGVPREERARLLIYDMENYYPRLAVDNPWSTPDFYLQQAEIPHACWALRELNKLAPVAVVSRRPEVVREASADWLAYRAIFYPFIANADKVDLAVRHDALAAVEDETRQALQLAARGLLVFLVKCPWNSELRAALADPDRAPDFAKRIVPVDSIADVPNLLRAHLAAEQHP